MLESNMERTGSGENAEKEKEAADKGDSEQAAEIIKGSEDKKKESEELKST